MAYLDDLSTEAAGDRSLQLELARAYERIGEVQGTGPVNVGQTDAARTSFERAIGLLERLGESLEVRRTLASVYLKHDMVLQRKAEPDRARESLGKALEIAGPLFAANPGDVELYRILFTGYTSRATAEGRAGNGRAALEAIRQALALTWTGPRLMPDRPQMWRWRRSRSDMRLHSRRPATWKPPGAAAWRPSGCASAWPAARPPPAIRWRWLAPTTSTATAWKPARARLGRAGGSHGVHRKSLAIRGTLMAQSNQRLGCPRRRVHRVQRRGPREGVGAGPGRADHAEGRCHHGSHPGAAPPISKPGAPRR